VLTLALGLSVGAAFRAKLVDLMGWAGLPEKHASSRIVRKRPMEESIASPILAVFAGRKQTHQSQWKEEKSMRLFYLNGDG